jgi:hypothetical protein
MHGAGGYVNHFALVDVDPVEQVLGGLIMDSFFELRHGDAGLQSEADLRAGLGVGHVPAFGFAPGLTEALRSSVVGVDLD